MINHKGFNLPGDLPLISFSFVSLIYYSLLLRIRPIKQIVEQIEQEEKKEVKSDLHVEQIVNQEVLTRLNKKYRAANFFLRRIMRTERPCLRRTLMLHRWCIKNNLQSHICIGVKKNGTDLESHAWLELQGIHFQENLDQLNSYTLIFRGY